MKKVVLKHFTKNGDSYQVNLGNGTSHTFNSLRSLHHFLNQTNQFLTEQAFFVHTIYTDTWQEYQRIWFYFGFGEKYNYSAHFQSQALCSRNLKDCEDHLNLAFDKSDCDNGNHFTFKHIRVSILCLKDSIKTLLPLYKKRSQTADIYRMNALFLRLLDIETRINSYAQIQATNHLLTKLKKSA
jgi:hypothetical protein